MARGWDPGNRFGTGRILCALPPGPGGGGGGGGAGGAAEVEAAVVALGGGGTILGPNDFKPNAFTGMYPITAAIPPLIDPGVNDFSFEFWYAPRTLPVPPFIQGYSGVGFAAEYPPIPPWWIEKAFITMDVTNTPPPNTGTFTLRYDADPFVLPTYVASFYLSPPVQWNHIAMNFTRLGNQDLYLNGTLVDSDLIDNVNFGAERFFALTGLYDDLALCDLPGQRNAGNNMNPYVVIGPIALHIGSLLSVGQLNDSLRGKRVNNFAATVINWDWRNIQGHTGWQIETSPPNPYDYVGRILALAVDYLPFVGAPIGAPGTVFIPDTSGNGNDYVLPTSEFYTLTLAEKANVGFFNDPWWAN